MLASRPYHLGKMTPLKVPQNALSIANYLLQTQMPRAGLERLLFQCYKICETRQTRGLSAWFLHAQSMRCIAVWVELLCLVGFHEILMLKSLKLWF